MAFAVLIAFWTAFVICNRRISRFEFEPLYIIATVALAFYSFLHADMTHELAQNLGHSEFQSLDTVDVLVIDGKLTALEQSAIL